MGYLKGILLSTLVGALLGFVALYTTYHEPSGCLDICISSPGLVGVIGAIAGFAFGIVEGVIVGLISRFDWCKRPRHYAYAGTGVALSAWVILCVLAGTITAGETAAVAVAGALLGLAYAAGANGLQFLRQL